MNINFWQKYKKIIIIFLIWWIAINCFAFLTTNRFNFEQDTAYRWINEQWLPESSNSFLNLHARWDSWFYIDIAENGYSCAEGELCNSVFFPLYPFLIKIFSFLPGINYYLAGFLISNLCIFGAVIVFYKLLLLKYSRQIAEKAVWFLLIFPTSFFFVNIYTESLFLLLSLSCFYFIFKEKWKMAGIMGLLASFTRVTGFLLFFPMLWEFFRKEKKKYKEIPWLILPLLGPLIFFSYHWKKFGDFFLFFKVEKLWGREILHFNFDHLDLLTNPAKINLFLDLFILLFVLTSIIFVWKKIRKSYAVYMGLSLFVPLSTGTLMSSNRYVLVLFPIYILMAVWAHKNSEFEKIYTMISILLFALYIILFVNNYWAG